MLLTFCIEAKERAELPTMHSRASTTKNHLENIINAPVDNSMLEEENQIVRGKLGLQVSWRGWGPGCEKGTRDLEGRTQGK